MNESVEVLQLTQRGIVGTLLSIAGIGASYLPMLEAWLRILCLVAAFICSVLTAITLYRKLRRK